jgi:Holliday junction resolvasome RuvABC endonuclease subunit
MQYSAEIKVLGIDTSTYTGVALVQGGEIKGKCVNFPKQKGWERLQSIAQEVERTVKLWSPDLIIIEDYAVYRASSVITVVECGTVVRKVLYDLGYEWYGMPPSSLKLWLTGKGNAKKPQMVSSTMERWGYQSPSDDIVDAVALAKFGQEFHANGMKSDLKGLKRHGRTKAE